MGKPHRWDEVGFGDGHDLDPFKCWDEFWQGSGTLPPCQNGAAGDQPRGLRDGVEPSRFSIFSSSFNSSHIAFITAKMAASGRPRSQAKYHMISVLSQ
jgi:hypothetical protein